MGKVDSSLNLPANGSLSLTLNDLRSIVEIETSPIASESVPVPGRITYLPELPRILERTPGLSIPPVLPSLSESGIERVLKHVQRVQNAAQEIFPKYGLRVNPLPSLKIRTANTFPAASGIASSASSFAAVTLATSIASCEDPEGFRRAWRNELELRRSLAHVSRQGSGSSCRSFEGPWVKWEGNSSHFVGQVQTQMSPMTDLVILISSTGKEVSSSQAHSWVQSSPLWQGRVDRASQRLATLEGALARGNGATVSDLAWTEFWEMHSLFHTCPTPFTYWEPETLRVLKYFSRIRGDAIVTMDAGANVHVLIPSSEAEQWKARIQAAFPRLPILEDQEGKGADILDVFDIG